MAACAMIPLCITAEMAEPVEWVRPVELDALLASQQAHRLGLHPTELVPIEIPVEKEPGGRFRLSTVAEPGTRQFSRCVHIHKRAPIQWYAQLCTDRVRRVDCGSGPDKGVRKPNAGSMYDALRWWCIGDPDKIAALLLGVTRVGARRRHGCGTVKLPWRVEPCKPWGDGFPVVRDGRPMRNLPLDWPGLLHTVRRSTAVLTFPYWDKSRVEMLAVPEVAP